MKTAFWVCLSLCIGFVLGLLWREFKQFYTAIQRPAQKESCRVFCPCCRQLLVAGQSACWDGKDGLVYYTCECGVQSRWDFDPPVPVLIGVTRTI